MKPVAAETAERAASSALEHGWRVATAESLTAGAVASSLGAASGASDWFAGGVVAYGTDVKKRVLGVTTDTVVSAECARQMAASVAELLRADAAVATTGAGGPDPQDGRDPGTVFIAVRTPNAEVVAEHHFEGAPDAVVEQTVEQALRLLTDHLG
jgi:nicotinamide-nucleotide amidase